MNSDDDVIFYKQRLNAGYVRIDKGWHMGDDLLPVEAARMSTGNPTGEDEAKDDATREFLWRKAHSTPFEMSVLHVEIQCPIFVAREIFRHRVFSFNEFSARYAVLPNLYYVPTIERATAAAQSDINKQASDGIVPEDKAALFIEQAQIDQCLLRASYEQALDDLGIARELARLNVPVSQYTRFRMQGNLRGWLHFLNLRLRSNVQPECRVYAEAIADAVKMLWPKCWEIFEEYTLYAASLSKSDRLIVSKLLSVILNEALESNLSIEDKTERLMVLLVDGANVPKRKAQDLLFKILTTQMTDEAR